MGSPQKRRKRGDPTPSRPVKTLHDYFGKRPAAPTGAAPGPAALTDEKYAWGLADEGRKGGKVVDGAAVVEEEGGTSVGVKRRRSGSPSPTDATSQSQPPPPNGQEPGAAPAGRQRATTTPEPRAPAPTTPATPKKLAVSARDVLEIEETTNSMPFDSDALEFDPDAYKSIVEKWPDGRATYGLLTRMFVLVNSTRSRIKIVDTLVNSLRVLIRLDPESLLPAVWLTTNDIGPSYETNELGIGGSIVSKAILKTSGLTPAALKKLHNKHGDPGDVAFEAKVKQRTLMMRKPTPLTIKNVYTTLVKISGTSGKGSQDTKQRHVERLLVDAKGEEIRYLTRTLVQHLRIGAVKTTMLIALSRAFSLSAPDGATWKPPDLPGSKEGRQELFRQSEEAVKRCFSRRPNYNDIVPCLLSGGVQSLESNCGMGVHIPLKPMLGSITRDLAEMIEKLQGRDFSCEYKYDGQRAQIHCDEFGKVSVFSRHLELMTGKYPDIADLVPRIRGEGVRSFIMEGEVVAVDGETGLVKNFQTLAGRERKNVDVGRISVEAWEADVRVNPQELLSRPFRERRELLRSMFVQVPHRFRWVESLDATSADIDAVRDFFRSSLDLKCEGIMVKVLDSSTEPLPLTPEEAEIEEPTNTKKGKGKEEPRKGGGRRKALLATYEPDKRLESWLKVKKDYDSAADTLDLVPIAAWHGTGRKSSWWSPILLAIRNPDTGTFEAVCKCMSGFTDKFYTSMKETYSPDGPNTCPNKKPYYEARLDPAVWFEPKEVWEVAFADITLSPTYTAALGLVSDQRGLSLRFPRFVRRREDKGVEDASTPQFLADLYFRQERGAKKKEAGEAGGVGGEVGGEEQKAVEEGEEEEEGEEREEGEEQAGAGGNIDVESDG